MVGGGGGLRLLKDFRVECHSGAGRGEAIKAPTHRGVGG